VAPGLLALPEHPPQPPGVAAGVGVVPQLVERGGRERQASAALAVGIRHLDAVPIDLRRRRGVGEGREEVVRRHPHVDGQHDVRYVDLSPAAKAAVLQMDPIRDAEEYNVLLHSEAHAEGFDAAELVRAFRASADPARVRLANRMENLQVLEWDLWSRGTGSVVDAIHERPRATVMDLGGFDHPVEPKVAALAVLEQLWARREERRPLLVVIDEAHNLCSPEPTTEAERALTQQLIQIAAEGRKFGLWLFLST
jgi:uncharacterized protein